VRSVRLVVNGKEQAFASELTVAELLQALSIRDGRVAVEVNLDVVARESRERFALKDGDQVEIVSFVGGGCT
jgi:sulfur carrier protein